MISQQSTRSGREAAFEWLEQMRVMFRHLGVTAVDPDRFLTEMAAKMRDGLAADDREMLTLSEAARRTGLSEDHLGRLVREGKVPNSGQKGRPRVRASDLPRRTRRAFATSPQAAYDPDADARALLGRRGGKRT